MLRKLLPNALNVELRGRSRRFRSPAALEVALDGNIHPSPGATAAYLDLDEPALRRELDKVSVSSHDLAEILATAGNRPDRISAGLRALDPMLVSKDNGWRELIARLRPLGARHAGYHAVALEKYAQYLTATADLLRSIHTRRLSSDGHAPLPGVEPPAGAEPRALRQRLTFDLGDLDPAGDASGELTRVTKGQALEFKFRPHQSMLLKLARYEFTLVSGDPFRVIDDRGHDRPLPFGRTVVGRGGGRDATIDPSYRAVSREHLILEIKRSGDVTLTDISSLGTFVAATEVE